MAEALAEYLHKQIRVEWGIAGSDAREKQELFKQRYQGSRYSFRLPRLPALGGPAQALATAATGAYRRRPIRGIPTRTGTDHDGADCASQAGEIFQRAVITGEDVG